MLDKQSIPRRLLQDEEGSPVVFDKALGTLKNFLFDPRSEDPAKLWDSSARAAFNPLVARTGEDTDKVAGKSS